jgi:kynurenine formamidase
MAGFYHVARVRVVDLSQPLGERTVPWVGSAPLLAQVLGTHDDEVGVYYRRLDLEEHYGTHIDAPGHFAAGGRLVHELAADELVLPAVVLDCHEACGDDPDFTLGVDAIEAFEDVHGPIAAGTLVLACTGWDRFHDDAGRYLGDPPRFPGYGLDAARRLVERDVAAIGIDTLSVDPGYATTDSPVHHTTSPRGIWHVEGLVSLDRLPPVGATVVVGALRLVDGSGTPARVLALIP